MPLFPIIDRDLKRFQRTQRDAVEEIFRAPPEPEEPAFPFGPATVAPGLEDVLGLERPGRAIPPLAPTPVTTPLAIPTRDPSVITPPRPSDVTAAPEIDPGIFTQRAPFADLPPGQEVIENRLNDPRSVQLTALELVALPFDVLDETAVELAAQVVKVARGGDFQLELPTVLQPGEGKILEAGRQLRERSLPAQLGAGLLGGVLTGGAGLAAKTGVALTKATGRQAARLIGSEVAEAAGRRIGEDVVESLTGTIAPGRAKRLEDLQEFGLTLDSSANEFTAPLRPWQAVESEVVAGTGVGANLAARLGVNPSALRASAVGRAATTFQRQQVAADQLVSTAMAAAFDSHLGQFRGLPVDPKTGFWRGTGVPWQRVFEQPDKFAKHINPGQRRLIDDVNQMTNDEVLRLLDDSGIDQRVRSRPDSEYFVPRNVEEIRGIEIRRNSDPNLQRHYEDITEGLDAGIVYGKNPRQDIELYMRWAYRKVAKKQLDDALELQSVTAKQLVPEDIRVAYADAITSRRRIEVSRRRVRKGISTAQAQLRVVSARVAGRGRAVQLTQTDISRLDAVIDDIALLPFEEAPVVPIFGVEKVRTRELGRVQQARQDLIRLKRRERAQRGRGVTATTLQTSIKAREDILEAQLENIDLQLDAARVTYRETRTAYLNRIDELAAGRAEVGPGRLWGLDQPNEIAIGSWRNRYFQRADADLLNDLIGKDAAPGIATRSLQKLVNTIRFLSTVGDFALPLTHGLPVLATNPVAWAKMTFQHERAFFFPTVQAKLIRENLSDYQWLARNGVPVGDPEFFAALELGQGISFQALFSRLPKGDEVQRFSRLAGRQTFGRFQASYNVGLGWARVQLLKGARTSWKGTDAELAQYIRNLTGGLDSKALGVGPTQRAAEGVWLAFSPRLLRSTLALTKDAIVNPTSQVGRRSLRSLAVLATGAISTYVMTGIALGKDWDEIEQGINPLNGKRFLSYQINGDWIGVGGQVRAIAQLLSTSVAAPDQLLTPDRYDNPLIRFITGRAAIGQALVGGVIEAATGGKIDVLPFEEIDGPLSLIKHVGESALPFTLQGIIEGEQTLTSGFAFRGFRTSPETAFDKRNAARQAAKAQLGIETPDEDLDFAERARIDKLVPAEVKKGVADLQRKRGSEIQALTDRLSAIDEDIDRSIDIAAAEGPGRVFRERLSDLNRTRADRKDQERTGPQHREALQFFEELEPSKARLDIIRDAYFEAITDPLLEDALGDFDFDRLERNIQSVRDRFSPQEVEEVERAIRADEHPLAKELRADRETLRAYWRTREYMIDHWQQAEVFNNEAHVEFYQRWLDAPPTRKSEMRSQFPALINPVEALVRRRQTSFRLNNHVVDGLLAKWEYSTAAPLTVGGTIEREKVLVGQQ